MSPAHGFGSLTGDGEHSLVDVEVVESLGRWAETWVDVLPEHTDPGFALWAWCRVQLNRDALPAGRVVVHFEFPDEQAGNRFFWLLDWHRGVLSWSHAVRGGAITVTGNRSLARAFPTWNTGTPALA